MEELIKLFFWCFLLDILIKLDFFSSDAWMSVPKVSHSFLQKVRKVPLSMFDVILTHFLYCGL